jgi:GT2 family glycosyltransferase
MNTNLELAHLAVVVLQWGRVDETLRCLEALRHSRGVTFALMVVDNASPEPDAVARIAREFPDVTLVQNESNLGFAAGNNVALRRLLTARAEARCPRWCLLLNNDVEVHPDCLRELLMVAVDKRAGAVGAINYLRGCLAIGSSGGFIDWPATTYRDAGATAVALGEPLEVQTLSGSTLLLDLDAVAEVGLLDADYFCVWEETDFCFRLREAGRRLWLAPAAAALHAVGASTPRSLHFYFRFRNRIRFARRHGGERAIGGLLPALFRELLWRLPAYYLTGRRREAQAILRGLSDGWHGRFGPGPLLETSVR